MADRRLSASFKVAALNGDNAAVRALLRQEGVNCVDVCGKSPLILAASRGHLGTCKLLLSVGANADLVDFEGNSAQIIALQNGWDQIANTIDRYLTAMSYIERASHFPTTLSAPARETPITISAPTHNDSLKWEESEYVELTRAGDAKIKLAAELHKKISNHVPIDTAASWSDVQIQLP